MVDVAGFDARFGNLVGALDLTEVEALLALLEPLELVAGEVLITEGTATTGLHLVWDGTLEASVGDGTNLGSIGRGDFVGEISLLDPGPATATVRSEQGATVLTLYRERLADFEAAHPRAAAALEQELAKVLARRTRAAVRRFGGREAAPVVPPAATGPLDDLVAGLERETVPAGELLGRAGRRADAAFLLLEGTVVRRHPVGDGHRELLRLSAPCLVGAESLLPAVLSTDLVALTPLEIAVLPAARLPATPWADATAGAEHRLVAPQLARELRVLAEAARTAEEPRPETVASDVAVIGGGMIGLAYAWFLKEARPAADVTVLERRGSPGYKIGESTLGTTTRCMLRMGLDLPVLRRLFGIKAGIRFWWTAPGDRDLHRHVDAGDVDETFQVERRVLETALIESARRRGIDVRTGTRVLVPSAQIGADGAVLPCEAGAGPFDLRARLVCDATGPAAALPRRFGVYRRAPERLGTFNSNAYYAYFRQRSDVPRPFWDAPATRHVCFEQGWCWFITVISWEGTPQESLEAMVRHLLDHPAGPDERYPTRRELEERFGCRSEAILSVGFTIREDRDTAGGLSLQGRFQHYLDRYPAIAEVLQHYELIEEPYGKQPYSAFLNIAHDAAAVTGDGWCAVGDSAGFSNPLLSPGLNFGTGTAYEAAQDSARALASGDSSRGAFRAYQHYADRTHATLMALNDLLYRSFRHGETFERALALFFFHSAQDVLAREEYSETDPYVWDLLNPEFTRRVDEVRRVLRVAEERGTPAEEVVREVRDITDPYIRGLLARSELAEVGLRSALREFDRHGERAAERHTGAGPFSAARCPQCRLWFDASLERCPVCGEPNVGQPPQDGRP